MVDLKTKSSRAVLRYDQERGFCNVAISPDATRLALNAFDESRFDGPDFSSYSVQMRDVRTGTKTWASVKTRAGLRVEVHCLAFSRDGRTLAKGGGAAIVLKDTRTGKFKSQLGRHWTQVFEVNEDQEIIGLKGPLTGHFGHILSIAFSPDGKSLASASTDQAVRLWNLRTGTSRLFDLGPKTSADSVAFSPDGKILASASFIDYTIRFWKVPSGKLIRELPCGEGGHAPRMVFSPDGRLFAVPFSETRPKKRRGPGDPGPPPRITLWNVATGKLHLVIKAPDDVDLNGKLIFSPDGKTIASGSRKGILFWDLSNNGTRLKDVGGQK